MEASTDRFTVVLNHDRPRLNGLREPQRFLPEAVAGIVKLAAAGTADAAARRRSVEEIQFADRETGQFQNFIG